MNNSRGWLPALPNMQTHKLDDNERLEVFVAMLRRTEQDHPKWRRWHQRRYAQEVTERFIADFETGKITLAEDEPTPTS